MSYTFRKTSALIFLIAIFILVLIQVNAHLLKNILIVDSPLRLADALVVMAGSQSERLPVAVDLFKKGMASKILLTNDGVLSAFSREKQQNLYQVEWAEEKLVRLGIPSEKIVKLPFYGSATMFDALAVKKYLLKSGLKKILVVTSDYHTRRTFWTFSYVLKGYPVDISVFPAESISVGTKGIVVEYCKIVYYVLRYGLLGLVPEAHEVALKEQGY